MAKKIQKLTFSDIVLNADAETIQQALTAKVDIDRLLEERARAFQQIAELEIEIENVFGEPGVYPFPQPPLPVAGFNMKSDTVTRPKSWAPAKPVSEEEDPDDSPEGNEETAGKEEDA